MPVGRFARARGEKASVAATQARVHPTTQVLWRPEASETAPTQGARNSTATDERLVATE